MKTSPLPLTRDLVLVGGGHTHALVLRMWAMNPLPGARLTLINPGPTAPYSGMLPGFVAGHYAREDLDIDLVKLARFAGARIILGAAEHIDRAAQLIHVPGRPPIAYDIVSIDVGITSEMPALPGFAAHGVPAKPLGVFAQKWHDFRQLNDPARIASIGGGIAGAELILAMAHALKSDGRAFTASLIDSGTALAAVSPRSAARIRRALSDYNIELIENAAVTNLYPGGITLADGRKIASDFTVGAAGAKPYDWLSGLGLEMTRGFLNVNLQLQTSDPQIFAVGDCAEMTHAPRPKAGVYAVRQAPVLLHNLRASLKAAPLKPYSPQSDYLKLVSLGARAALADKRSSGLLHAAPPELLWRWKDRIDQRFMEQFRDLPSMAKPAALPQEHASGLEDALGDKPMCGGCGAKVGRAALSAAIATYTGATRADVVSLPGDDAAVLNIGDLQQVISTDHLRQTVEDPVIHTEITAHHALNDIWAMGARPQAATVTVILPRLSDELQSRMLKEIMESAHRVMATAGCAIVGGHSSIGDELTVGFTLTGLLDHAPITLSGAEPGDALILTKPLGSGTMLAGEMAGLTRGADFAAALKLLCQSQASAAQLLQSAKAMTDVTGFGLIGHLDGICRASAVGAELVFDDIPLMSGAAELARAGIRSTIYPENRALAAQIDDSDARALLFDPQTSGGLLAAVPSDTAGKLVAALQAHSYQAAHIGRITDATGINLR